MSHPNSLKNLKMFEKGNKGGGRKKGSVSLVYVLKKLLKKEIDIKDPFTKAQSKAQLREAVALALVTKALKGDVSAIKEIIERVDGKVLQKTEITSSIKQIGEMSKDELLQEYQDCKKAVEALDDTINTN
jgi:hypothetical protein